MSKQPLGLKEFEEKEAKTKRYQEIAILMQEMSASPDLNDRVIRALKDRGLVRSEVAKPQASTVLNALQRIEGQDFFVSIKQGITPTNAQMEKLGKQQFFMQQKPRTIRPKLNKEQVQISKQKGGTGEVMSASDQISIPPNKLGAKQQVQEEESKSIGSVKGSVHSAKQSQSSKESVKSAKSTQSEQKGKSHQLLMELTDDSQLRQLIPSLNTADQLVQSGSITEKQSLDMKSQAIHENMHNKQIESIVNDIVTKALKGSSSSQSSSKSSNKSKKSAYGQAPTVNDDLDLPKKDESNSLAGQAQQIPKPVVGVVFDQYAQVKDDIVQQTRDSLRKIQQNHPNTDAAELAKQLETSFQQNQIQASIAVAEVQQPHISQVNQPASEQIVTGMSASPQLDQKEKSIVDVLNNPSMKQYVEDQLSKSGQSDQQKELSRRTLRDVESVSELVSRQIEERIAKYASESDQSQNYDEFMETGGLNNRNKQKGKARTVKGKNQGIDMQSDDMSGVSKQIREIDPKSRGTSQLFDVGGSKVSEEFIKEVMKDTIDKISKIVGDLPTIATYTTFRNQTEVFGTKIQQKESNQFSVKQGSAFRLRRCK